MNNDAIKRFLFSGARVVRRDPRDGMSRLNPVASLSMKIYFCAACLGMRGIFEIEYQNLDFGALREALC